MLLILSYKALLRLIFLGGAICTMHVLDVDIGNKHVSVPILLKLWLFWSRLLCNPLLVTCSKAGQAIADLACVLPDESLHVLSFSQGSVLTLLFECGNGVLCVDYLVVDWFFIFEEGVAGGSLLT